MQSHQSVQKGIGIINQKFISKTDFSYNLLRRIVPPLFSYPLGIFDEKTPLELQKSLTIPKLDSIII